MDAAHKAITIAVLVGAFGCGDDAATPPPEYLALYASEVVDYSPGVNAGFGQDALPGVVTGPPLGAGSGQGTTDVLSLGVGGSITLGFSQPIVDVEGPDFVVFENPFYISNDPTMPYAELAEVGVSSDGESWTWFECTPGDAAPYPGCAGWTPTMDFDPADTQPLDAELTGGDAFDLASVGVSEVRFVQIRDLSEDGETPAAGFDLDAVGIITAE